MNHLINDLLMSLNNIGSVFYSYAASIFVQSSLMVVILFLIDLLLRRKVRAIEIKIEHRVAVLPA